MMILAVPRTEKEAKEGSENIEMLQKAEGKNNSDNCNREQDLDA